MIVAVVTLRPEGPDLALPLPRPFPFGEGIPEEPGVSSPPACDLPNDDGIDKSFRCGGSAAVSPSEGGHRPAPAATAKIRCNCRDKQKGLSLAQHAAAPGTRSGNCSVSPRSQPEASSHNSSEFKACCAAPRENATCRSSVPYEVQHEDPASPE